MELVKFDNDKLITELKTVCEVFNKRHDNVMRDIKNIIKDLPQLESEFITHTHTTSKGNTYNTYYLTEKGFYILTSSFKGTKARLFQPQFFDEFKRLQEENTNLYLQAERTYCISDIAQRFKNLTPLLAQHELIINDWLEYRNNGTFPSEYVDNQNEIIAVYDRRRCKFYPRYTIKGCKMVEDFLLEKGYELK